MKSHIATETTSTTSSSPSQKSDADKKKHAKNIVSSMLSFSMMTDAMTGGGYSNAENKDKRRSKQ